MVKTLKMMDTKKALFAMVVAGLFMMLLMGNMFTEATSTVSGTGLSNRTFPWTAILYTLMNELTGPLPRILGVLGLAAAAIALFAGNGGAGTQKFIMLIFAVSIALFAPSFIGWMVESTSEGTSGVTIYDAAMMLQGMGGI